MENRVRWYAAIHNAVEKTYILVMKAPRAFCSATLAMTVYCICYNVAFNQVYLIAHFVCMT